MRDFHGRVVANVPADGLRVVVLVRVRRLVCPVPGCPRQTFREQVPGVMERDIACNAHTRTLRTPPEPAAQSSFFTGSRIATHST